MSNFSFQYPTWFIILCIAVAFAYAVFFYYRDKRISDYGTVIQYVLGILRFLTVFGICFLLLGPLLKRNKQEIKNPSIVLIQDASSSVSSDTQAIGTMRALDAALSPDFQVDKYHFSNTMADGLTDSLNGLSTDLSAVYRFLDETYANQNLGAVIISTDGIFNEGINPFYQKNNLTAPVYFIAQGDTTLKKDISIKQVYHNQIAYLGDEFIVQPDIFAYNFKGTTTQVSIYKDSEQGQLLQRKTITIDDESFFQTLEMQIPADQVGVVKYVVNVESKAGEQNRANNRYEIYVDVLDARQKIAIIANAPHPDIKALKSLITANVNYEVESFLADSIPSSIEAYDLVIIHNLPNDQYPITGLLKKLNDAKKAQFFIAGTQANVPKLNQAQDLVSIQARTNSINEITAEVVKPFPLFQLSDELKTAIRTFPPMKSLFGNYKPGASTTTLLNQKIGTVETEYPLLSFSDNQGIRKAFLAGEGLWRWRLQNYQEHQNFDLVQELMNKTIQYLSIKEDKRKFRVNATNHIFKEFDRIQFEAELYNDSYEKINEPDATLRIINEAGEEYSYTFSKYADFYQLDAGNFPPGNYRYKGEVNYSGKLLQSEGKFSIREVQLENVNTTADHQIMRSLVGKSGGDLFYQEDASTIAERIKTDNPLKPVIYNSSKTDSILNLKWIFFLLMGLLIVEWFIRRYIGSY